VTGERLSQAGWLGPSETGREIMTEAGFTSSSDSVRALSVTAKKELSREGRLETAPT